jgi:L-amino acid N-acyltransferase YncA
VIRQAIATDAAAISRIYNHYILDSVITFEEQPVSPAEMAERIAEVTLASLPWLIAEQDDSILGYARASKWKGRSAYRFSVETTIYLAPDCLGRGIGTSLYQLLLKQLKDLGLHVAIGGIALPNAASVALHEKLGFRKVAQFAEVGFKFSKWIDVGYWQLTL